MAECYPNPRATPIFRYKPGDAQRVQLDRLLGHRLKSADQLARVAEIRDAVWKLGDLLNHNCPASGELTLALRALQLASFHAETAITANE